MTLNLLLHINFENNIYTAIACFNYYATESLSFYKHTSMYVYKQKQNIYNSTKYLFSVPLFPHTPG